MIKNLVIILTSLAPLYSLGQSDNLQKEHSKWILFGKSRHDISLSQPDSNVSQPKEIVNGYSINYRTDSTKIAEGLYNHDRKTGSWIYYFEDGITIERKETYKDGTFEGPYVKYYHDGTLKESGYYVHGKRKTRTARYYPSGCLEYETYFDESGREDGLVTYYFDCDTLSADSTGQIEFVYNSVSGIPVGKATRYYPNGQIQEVVEYGFDGRVISKEEKE